MGRRRDVASVRPISGASYAVTGGELDAVVIKVRVSGTYAMGTRFCEVRMAVPAVAVV